MICYKDMTFCNSNCTNRACSRFVSEDVKEGARNWWGSDDYPIALSDFSDTCEAYEAPPKYLDNNE